MVNSPLGSRFQQIPSSSSLEGCGKAIALILSILSWCWVKGMLRRFQFAWPEVVSMMLETFFSKSFWEKGPISCCQRGRLLSQLSFQRLVSRPFFTSLEVLWVKMFLSFSMLLQKKEEFWIRFYGSRREYFLVKKLTHDFSFLVVISHLNFAMKAAFR